MSSHPPSSTDSPVCIPFSALRLLTFHTTLLCLTLLSCPNPRAGMELGATTALYPLHRCKTIYLVRHAQGIHNVAGEKDFGAYMSHELFDAQLTPLGWNQVDGLREHVKKSGLAEKIELVISSPLLRYSLIENDEDVLWEPDVREPNEAVALRGMKFMDWLWTREEKEIAIVSHSGFLFHTLSMYSKECHPTISDEVSKHFANCELRSMVLVDRSMLGSYSSRFNYAGKNPTGLDVPSDIADKKQVDEAQKN
ncbi:Phosphoglycerate mutase-like protein [Zea mays]|uniref:Phosphoglycerate mutase-like protein n=1 Tax=Zea mays TaxID=4577 RepID=A0A1D6J380_MAIZE|nr:Phosphoglycerate mutase-like protein [Zea mays]